MRFVQGFELYRKLAEPVARPNQLGSLLQLAKKVRVTDDAARRLLDQLAAELNHPLIVVQDRRITLTDAGRQLLEVAVKLSAIAENSESPPDVLTVEADPLLAECLLPQAFVSFLDLWTSMVQPRVCPIMQSDRTRKNIHDGMTAFAIAADSGESVSPAETLGPKVPWVLVLPKNHRLAGTDEPITAESLTVNDRVFIPELGADWPGMDGVLKAVPNHNRIVCESALGIRLAAGGLGAAIVPGLLPDGEFACKRVIQVNPVQPRFVFPKRGFDGLTEPEQSLVEQIRKVAEGRTKQEPAPPETKKEADDVFEALVEETVTPLEGVLS